MNLHVNPACHDEERAYQRHEVNVIAAFVQDAFWLPNPEEIVPGCDGCEKKRNEMIVPFPMTFKDDRQERDGKQEDRKRQHDQLIGFDLRGRRQNEIAHQESRTSADASNATKRNFMQLEVNQEYSHRLCGFHVLDHEPGLQLVGGPHPFACSWIFSNLVT